MKRILLFSLIMSTLAPGILATVHFSPFISLFSIALGFDIAYITYLLVNVDWNYSGLYGYTKRLSPLVSKVFLGSWLVSYYLYVIYTPLYITYYVLNLSGLDAILLTFILVSLSSILAVTEYAYYAFPVIMLTQIVLVLPVGWKFNVSVFPTSISYLFLNILSSSLVVVCITLSTFIKGDKRFSHYILLGYGISSIFLLYGSFMMPNAISVYGTSLGNFGLILAEFLMLNNLLKHELRVKKNKIYILSVTAIVLSTLGTLDYEFFYIYLIYPSVMLLYLSLLLSFPSLFKFYKSLSYRFLGLLSLLPFSYGIYSVVTSSGILSIQIMTLGTLALIVTLSLVLGKRYSSRL
ncbi:hypothetical protein SUSAZ_08305 [Sulfolobus acidocaldarius SUSAZ]|nr:hypothetical protein SUSAZ_08305 [Sulfolobus acidocaldarius SUSAZ]